MKPFPRLVSYLMRYKLIFLVALFCSFVYAGMNAASVYLIGPFLNQMFSRGATMTSAAAGDAGGFLGGIRVSLNAAVSHFLQGGTARESLTRLCLAIIVAIFLKNLFSYFHGYLMAIIEQGVIKHLRQDLYAAYHRLPLRFFQKRKTGEMISRVISDCTIINDNLNSSMMNLMKEPVTVLVLLSMMVVISWRLTLLIFLATPPSLWVIQIIGHKLRRRTTVTQDRIADMTSVLEETISGVRVVKAFAMERFEVDRFQQANSAFSRAMLKLCWMRRLAPPVTEFLGVTLAVGILWIGGVFVLEKEWFDPQAFFQFLVFMFMMMQSANKLSEVNVKIQVGIAASQRVFAIMDYRSEVADPPDPLPLDAVREGIRLRDVWYEYDPGVPVLQDINLAVRKGETIAIVGPSGGGKSTLMDLLPRFFDPIRGVVEIDGQDIRRYRLEDLRRLFGIVTQETILFHDSIRNNIAYGRPDIGMDEIVAAAEAANAHEFITGFEQGYETVIGDRGTKLSGGQRQRIVIARAILKNPPVLIFDEATSALDSKAETHVQAAIERLMHGRTTFIIAHRLSTIKSADRIVVVDGGRIVEEGCHADLYAAGNLYRRLHDLQFAGQEPPQQDV